jgi:DNA-binding phage protein
MMCQKTNLIAAGKEHFSQYHVAEYLTNSTDVAAYLKAAKEENDPALLAAVMEDIRQIETVQHASKTRILP